MVSYKASLAIALLNATWAFAKCATPDAVAPVCQTSAGSPLSSDCQAAIGKIGSNLCIDTNGAGCQTIATVGTCKIDACGNGNDGVQAGVSCGGYVQTILNKCQSGGRVGGLIHPAACNLQKGGNNGQYRLQFSHS